MSREGPPRGPLSSLTRRLVIGLVLAVLVYAGLALYSDTRALATSMAEFRWTLFGPMLALALANYALRFARWHLYLRVLGHSVPGATSASVFGSGLAMSVTPGKLGELLKAALLQESGRVPAEQTASVVIAERLTDFLALYLLLLLGIFSFRDRRLDIALVVGVVLLALGFAALTWRPFGTLLIRLVGRVPGAGRLAPRLASALDTFRVLLSPRLLVVALALSLVAWAAECLAYWLALVGVGALSPSVATAAFVYSAATIAGAVSMLPGGLGVTEGSMTLVIQSLLTVTPAAAGAATLVVRVATLWFAVLVGFAALAWYRARLKRQPTHTEEQV